MRYRPTQTVEAFRLGHELPPPWWSDMIKAKQATIRLKSKTTDIEGCTIRQPGKSPLTAIKGDVILRDISCREGVWVMPHAQFAATYTPDPIPIIANAEMLADIDLALEKPGSMQWVPEGNAALVMPLIGDRIMEEIIAGQAEIDAGVEKLIEQLPVPDTIEEAIAARNAWYETALQHCRNEEYYRGLVRKIGGMLGESAKLMDDGSLGDDILCAKVPELVHAEFVLSAALREENGRLHTELERTVRHQQGPAAERRLNGMNENGEFPICEYCERRHDVRICCPAYASRNGD